MTKRMSAQTTSERHEQYALDALVASVAHRFHDPAYRYLCDTVMALEENQINDINHQISIADDNDLLRVLAWRHEPIKYIGRVFGYDPPLIFAEAYLWYYIRTSCAESDIYTSLIRSLAYRSHGSMPSCHDHLSIAHWGVRGRTLRDALLVVIGRRFKGRHTLFVDAERTRAISNLVVSSHVAHSPAVDDELNVINEAFVAFMEARRRESPTLRVFIHTSTILAPVIVIFCIVVSSYVNSIK